MKVSEKSEAFLFLSLLRIYMNTNNYPGTGLVIICTQSVMMIYFTEAGFA